MVTKKPPAAKKITQAALSPATATVLVGAKLTVLQQLEKLDADRAQLEATRKGLLDTAKAELLAQGQTIIAGLKSLGYTYVLSEPAKKSHHKMKGEGGVRERATPSVMCPICNFHTSPQDHDRRSHRHQITKGPFTEAELQKRGLVRL